jgi:hypothetical protein
MIPMAMRRAVPLVLTCAMAAACTHDFDVFEPGPNGGGAPTDGQAGDGARLDSGAPADSPTTDGSGPEAATDGTGGCAGAGSITFGGHCYFLGSPASWDASKGACTSAGAHLVTIGSSQEQDALNGLAPTQDRWIGLSRPVGSQPRDSSYVWVTGEARTYTNWEFGEPNGSGECARLRPGGRWADNTCSTALAAICERE